MVLPQAPLNFFLDPRQRKKLKEASKKRLAMQRGAGNCHTKIIHHGSKQKAYEHLASS
jgi:hypothetical protein